jgi:DTW domain-containing protein YfiP
MGTLKPGATYVYERTGNEVYAREFGAAPNTRKLIGYNWDPVTGHRTPVDPRTPDGRPLHEHIMEDKMWGEIRRMSKTNPALQKALDRAIIIYRLSKDNPL